MIEDKKVEEVEADYFDTFKDDILIHHSINFKKKNKFKFNLNENVYLKHTLEEVNIFSRCKGRHGNVYYCISKNGLIDCYNEEELCESI